MSLSKLKDEIVGSIAVKEKLLGDELLLDQVDQAVEQKGRGDLEQLFKSGDTWTVE